MAEYINREKLEFDFRQCNRTDSNWTPQRVSQMIHRQSAEDVVPVRHGRWIIDGVYVVCSVCNRLTVSPIVKQLPAFKYCPNCGARMD